MRAMLALVILALLFPLATSAPGGIGTSADEGCLCHGEKNSGTAIVVTGLPDFFESNTTYNFSIELASENIPMESGKADPIVEKMIAGRMTKFVRENSLVGQAFVKNVETTVEELLASEGAEVSAMIRYEVGEGLEKRSDDFVAEVMAQVG